MEEKNKLINSLPDWIKEKKLDIYFCNYGLIVTSNKIYCYTIVLIEGLEKHFNVNFDGVYISPIKKVYLHFLDKEGCLK